MKEFRRFVVVVVGLMILFSLTACSVETDTSKITIWAWNKNVEVLKDAVNRYKEVNPDFDAEVVAFSANDIDTKFKAASQQVNGGKQLADILLGDAINMRAYIGQWEKLFVNFADYEVKAIEQEKFISSTIDLVKYDEKLFAMPYGIGPTVVFAYKPLWQSDDLTDIKTNGWTWDDYIEYGKKIKQTNADTYMAAYNMRKDDRIYRTMVSQLGDWFMDKDLNVQLGNDNSINAMSMIKKMNDENLIKHFDAGSYQAEMATGKIAAEIHGFATSGQIKSAAPHMSGDWEILPCPSWTKGGNVSSITGGSYLYVNNTINKSKVKRCVDFTKWYTLNADNALKGLEIGGIYTPLLSAYETDYFKNTTDAYFGGQVVYKDVADYTKNAVAIYPSKYFAYNLLAFTNAQEQILFNGKDVSMQLQIARELILTNKNL